MLKELIVTIMEIKDIVEVSTVLGTVDAERRIEKSIWGTRTSLIKEVMPVIKHPRC